MILKQAVNLANGLSVAFNTPSGVPYNDINPEMTGPAAKDFDMDSASANLAQAGTLILEWTRLSHLTGNNTYKNLAHNAQVHLMMPRSWGPAELTLEKRAVVEPWPGLVGFDIFLKNGTFKNGFGSWSGGADSFYEYLIKQWMYNATPDNLIFRNRWIAAVNSSRLNLRSHPVPRPQYNPLVPTQRRGPEVAFMQGWRADRTKTNFSQHLTCFDGGNILLGAQVLDEAALRNAANTSYGFLDQLGLRSAPSWPDFVRFGLELIEGCHHVYASTATQIGPEVFSWWHVEASSKKPPFFKVERPPAYILRPEVMESYYYAYRITGQSKYQDWAWDAFMAIDRYCRANFGYSAIRDVDLKVPAEQLAASQARAANWADEQESFWFAETLKYAYLIQQDASTLLVLSLND